MSIVEIVKNSPEATGVYIIKNASKKVIYVGKALRIRDRLAQYFISQTDNRPQVKYIVKYATEIDTIITSTEHDALVLESSLIKEYQPIYNVLLRDDKGAVFIYFSNKHDFPRLEVINYKEKSNFPMKQLSGPYLSRRQAKNIIQAMIETYPLRTCTDYEFSKRRNPCILHALHKCLAPCTALCNRDQYDTLVKNIRNALKGNISDVENVLTTKMVKASEQLNFERAEELLYLIKSLRFVNSYTTLYLNSDIDLDFFYLTQKNSITVLSIMSYRSGLFKTIDHFILDHYNSSHDEIGSALRQYYVSHAAPFVSKSLSIIVNDEIFLDAEKSMHLDMLLDINFSVSVNGTKYTEIFDVMTQNANAFISRQGAQRTFESERLEVVQEELKLQNFPEIIHCIDNSFTNGKDAVSCIVEMNDGRMNKSRYRKYILKDSVSSDVDAFKEVLARYFRRLSVDQRWPSLIIIDGGIQQKNIINSYITKYDLPYIDIVCIKKQDALHTKGLVDDVLLTEQGERSLKAKNKSLQLIQFIRDQAHDFTIRFHRSKRQKKTFSSVLDDITGLGPSRRQKLFKAFKSVKEIKALTLDELITARVVPEEVARRIYIRLHNES
ncbi:excinuclease ABC subunit UvrC [Chlamydiia bacterium]|nr:excinuclease ABC subunit UvrC [Chlamydiia bacterium]